VSCGLKAPGPTETFNVRTLAKPEHPVWYHVYNTRTHPVTAETFAQGWGNTRFAPIKDTLDAWVHTYYVASTAEAAYMESVLHDIPLEPPGMFEVSSLQWFHLATLELPDDLRYVSFHTPDLPRLGLSRGEIVDSLPACYPETRAWAEAAYRQKGEAQAVGYGSRRHDAARCLMLFGQRMPTPPFRVIADEPLATGARRAELLTLVRSLDLREI
jgi:hypothetical protein